MRRARNFVILVATLIATWFALPASMQTTIANNAADMSGKIVMVADSSTPRTVTNLFTFNRGAAVPFAVDAASLKVTNLDADKVDGLDSVRFRTTTVTTTSTGTQNNFDPSSTIALGYQVTYIRCNNAADLTVTGLPAGVFDGQIVVFFSVGAGNVLFQDASGGAGSTVELQNIATSAATPISTRGFARYIYDTTTGIWRLQSHEQGAWITPTFAAGNFTGAGGLTWTLAAGDVSSFGYRLSGRTLTVSWNVATTTTGGVANGSLQISNGAWGGFTPFVGGRMGTHSYVDAGGTEAIGRAFASGTTINLQKAGLGNWSNAAVDTTSSFGSDTFDVN